MKKSKTGFGRGLRGRASRAYEINQANNITSITLLQYPISINLANTKSPIEGGIVLSVVFRLVKI